MDWFDQGNGNRISPAWMVCFVLIGIAVLLEIRRASPVNDPDFALDPEVELLVKIRQADFPARRDALIEQLEQLPCKTLRFHLRWWVIHENGDSLKGWTDAGFDASASDLPRDLQLMAAASHGITNIDVGGFRSLFINAEGACAPEMVEWLEHAGLSETAAIVRKATAVFGPEFPRSQDQRHEFLKKSLNSKGEADPFLEWDTRFSESFSQEKFDDACDHWLREVCGIKDLKAPPRRESKTDR
jgi:hypothetical protein